MYRICKKCNTSKHLTRFTLHKGCRLGRSPVCKECTNTYIRDYNSRNKDKARNSRIKYATGITLDDYNLRLKAQKYRCAICNRHKNKFKKFFAVDHNHETGKVRGLLCFDCNTGIGKLKDSKILLEKAIKYLS